MKQQPHHPGVSVHVPASVANLGPGFDVFAIALKQPSIEVTVSRAPRGSKTIQVYGPYADEVTQDPSLHSGARALEALRHGFGEPESYSLRIKVDIPPRKGLGLSGAEAVGAIMAACRLFRLRLDKQSIARVSSTAEPSHHMDNVAASAFGGFNITSAIPSGEGPTITTLRSPKDLGVAVVVPDIEKTSTEAARRIVPETVSIEQYVKSLGYIAKISAAFAKHDVNAILEALPWDPVVEPARAAGGCYGNGVSAAFLQEEKRLLSEKFHVAETISGAGPSRALWYSISEDRRFRRSRKTSPIEAAIEEVSDRLKSLGHDVRQVFLTKPSNEGASIIS